MDETKLSELLPGATCEVVAVEGDKKLRRRILDMGVTPGTEIYVRKKAPLGDPIEVTLRGYELTLRKSEAALVSVAVKGDN